MDVSVLTQKLSDNARRIQALLAGVSLTQARWKPQPAMWSMLEVIGHLADEEQYDFRVRLDYTLHRPGERWPPIDPEGWVIAHRYNEGDLTTTLERFLTARAESIQWLRGLHQPDWNATYTAPFGVIRAGDLLAAWVAHDLLHLRQLVELHWACLAQDVVPYQTIYAGEW